MHWRCFNNFPYYQKTLQVLPTLVLEAWTLLVSAQLPTNWAATTDSIWWWCANIKALCPGVLKPFEMVVLPGISPGLVCFFPPSLDYLPDTFCGFSNPEFLWSVGDDSTHRSACSTISSGSLLLLWVGGALTSIQKHAILPHNVTYIHVGSINTSNVHNIVGHFMIKSPWYLDIIITFGLFCLQIPAATNSLGGK